MAGRTIRKFRGDRTNKKVTPIKQDMDNSSDIGRALMQKQRELRNKRPTPTDSRVPDSSAQYNKTQIFPHS